MAKRLLKEFAYYATGGTCDALYEPRSVAELQAAVRAIQAAKAPFFLLGGGTNSLVLDDHFPGAVIVFKYLDELRCDGAKVSCGAGIENSAVARLALERGLTGAAWMNRLPGQIGGTVRMNARCYGGEISQIVKKVTVVTREGEIKIYVTPKQIFRGYKDTVFMTNGDLIAGCEIALTPAGDRAAVQAQMDFCEKDRVDKGQFTFPSCGCVFKNDYTVGVSSGVLLDKAGAKQLKVGGAEVAPTHANFVFNKGGTSRDILEISFAMRELVYQAFGVWLAYEMEVLGALPPDLAAKVAEERPHRLDDEQLAPLRKQFDRA